MECAGIHPLTAHPPGLAARSREMAYFTTGKIWQGRGYRISVDAAHHAALRELKKVLYCNDGDWVESCTALVEYADGTLEILRWSHQQAVVAVREPRGLPETAPAPGWAATG